MAVEHLGLALALNVPVYVVVTKIDMCPENVLEVLKPTLLWHCEDIADHVMTGDDAVAAEDPQVARLPQDPAHGQRHG